MTTTNSDILEVLAGVGLSENEASVYLALLELGPSSVLEIARQTNLKRPTCYLILDELVLKAYASKTNDGRRTIYAVISPKQLQNRVERHYERFSQTVSELEAIGSVSPQKPAIRLYEGSEGVMQTYLLSLDQPRKSEILTYGTASVANLLPDFIPDYIASRVKRRITVKALLPDTPENRAVLKRDKTELRETRFLPVDRFDPQLEINQFGNTIAYIAHSEKAPFATVIDSATIANVERQRFLLIWDQATK